MQMPAKDFRKCARLLTLALMLTPALMGCDSLGLTSKDVTATASASLSPASAQPARDDNRPLVCSELRLVVVHGGKLTADGHDALTRQDVDAALALPTWPDQERQLRRLAGDTDSTVEAVKGNNAVLRRLCPPL